MRIAFTLNELLNETKCPICDKQLVWHYENMRSDSLEAYCCNKQFIAEPKLYTINIQNCNNI
jgi:hypothetical protein